jgi:serine phosphatase RsbU (regulator of sigma subunit)
MYFANNKGILKYDGSNWSIIYTSSEVTSICYDSTEAKIFVGCVEDFGFLQLNDEGKYRFVSLSDRILIKGKIGTVWDCISTDEGIYFLSDNKLIRYHEGKLSFWDPKNSFKYIFHVGKKLLISELGIGLFLVNNDSLHFIKGSEIFAESRVVFIDILQNNPNQLLIATREKGLFRSTLTFDNTSRPELNSWLVNKSTEELFKSTSLYSGIKLKDQNYAFCTVTGGLIITDYKGNLKAQYTIKNGLSSENLNDVFEDRLGNLWLCTENGISLIMWSLPVFTYNNSGNISGIVESMEYLQGRLFVATSAGIYVLNIKTNQFEKFNFPTTQVWQIVKIEGEEALFATTPNGIYKIFPNGYQLLSNTDLKAFAICKSKKYKNLYYLGLFDGLASFSYEKGLFQLHATSKAINYPIRAIHEDMKGNLWLSSNYNGIILIPALSNNLTAAVNSFCNFVNYTVENGLPNLNANFIHEINGEIVAITYNGIYRLNTGGDINSMSLNQLAKLKFSKYVEKDPYNPKEDIQIEELGQDSNKDIWIVALLPNGKREIRQLRGGSVNKQIDIPFKIISKDKINQIYFDSVYTWFGATDQIYCYDQSKKYNFQSNFNAQIHTVISNLDTIFDGNYYVKIKRDSTSYNQISTNQPEQLKRSFSYEVNDFTFFFSATSYIAYNPAQFSCILEGEDEKWSEWSNETSKVYMNLYEGKYIFKVKAKNIFGTESTVATYEFTILPPWYRTTIAYIIYIFLAIGFVIMVVNIFTRNLNRIIKTQTAELQKQKDEIVNKNKEITDSIYYAKRIQDAIMPSNEYIKGMFQESFVLFKPKDIVSGDFYWANLRENHAILTAVDCTGHGVPGAFMSMMGNDYLSDIIVDSKISDPAEILNMLRSGIIKALKQRGESGESKDGMDMALININKLTKEMEFAGANNPIYIVRSLDKPAPDGASPFKIDNSNYCLYEIKGNKFPVGIHMGTTLQPFTKQSVTLYIGDAVYLFSDGFADQFGGPNGKKLKYTHFKKLILESLFLSMEEQKIYLEQKLNDWQGQLEQVDDILVIGIRII